MVSISRTQFNREPDRFLEQVQRGETVVVTDDAGHPIAELRQVVNEPDLRPIGLAKGEFEVPDDFDAPLPEDVLRSFGLARGQIKIADDFDAPLPEDILKSFEGE